MQNKSVPQKYTKRYKSEDVNYDSVNKDTKDY